MEHMTEKPEFLSRKETARYLSQRGIQTAPSTLAAWAKDKKGPPYSRIDNGNALYKAIEVETWLQRALREGRVAR